MARYVFITGGVGFSPSVKALPRQRSGAASPGARLPCQAEEAPTPYLNVDPGTMSPYQHGEVFVYRRRLRRRISTLVTMSASRAFGQPGRQPSPPGASTRTSSTASGVAIISGATVQVIPHVTDEIKEFRPRRQ